MKIDTKISFFERSLWAWSFNKGIAKSVAGFKVVVAKSSLQLSPLFHADSPRIISSSFIPSSPSFYFMAFAQGWTSFLGRGGREGGGLSSSPSLPYSLFLLLTAAMVLQLKLGTIPRSAVLIDTHYLSNLNSKSWSSAGRDESGGFGVVRTLKCVWTCLALWASCYPDHLSISWISEANLELSFLISFRVPRFHFSSGQAIGNTSLEWLKAHN